MPLFSPSIRLLPPGRTCGHLPCERPASIDVESIPTCDTHATPSERRAAASLRASRRMQHGAYHIGDHWQAYRNGTRIGGRFATRDAALRAFGRRDRLRGQD